MSTPRNMVKVIEMNSNNLECTGTLISKGFGCVTISFSKNKSEGD